MMVRFFCWLFALAVLCASPALAAPTIQPGFRTLGIWEPETKIRLDLAIWYPTVRSPFAVDYGDWEFRVARGAPPLEGQHPVVLLSHDNSGSRFSLHQLATALARAGFLVVAPTHKEDNLNNMSALFSGRQLFSRAGELKAALDTVLSHPDLAPLADPQRIGVLGVGPGGTSALLLAGARLDASGWEGYCPPLSPDDIEIPPSTTPYCLPWTSDRMARMAMEPDLGRPFRDPRIRAAIAVAPQYSMFLTPKALSRIRIPVQLIQAEKDRMNPPPQNTALLASRFPIPPVVSSIPHADTATLMSSCSETLAQTLPELCLPQPPGGRDTVQRRLAQASLSFLVTQLGTPNPPPIPPDPPEQPLVPEKTKASPSENTVSPSSNRHKSTRQTKKQ